MKILIIEDHPYKLGQILNFMEECYSDIKLEVKGSYNSGLKELITNSFEYDLLLLDISMPNYDISPEEGGGDFLPLAGKLILKEMYLREISTKAIVVTMHGSFEDGTKLSDLDGDLRNEFSDNYLGYVYFTAISNNWKNELSLFINKNGYDKNISS